MHLIELTNREEGLSWKRVMIFLADYYYYWMKKITAIFVSRLVSGLSEVLGIARQVDEQFDASHSHC